MFCFHMVLPFTVSFKTRLISD